MLRVNTGTYEVILRTAPENLLSFSLRFATVMKNLESSNAQSVLLRIWHWKKRSSLTWSWAAPAWCAWVTLETANRKMNFWHRKTRPERECTSTTFDDRTPTWMQFLKSAQKNCRAIPEFFFQARPWCRCESSNAMSPPSFGCKVRKFLMRCCIGKKMSVKESD